MCWAVGITYSWIVKLQAYSESSTIAYTQRMKFQECEFFDEITEL